MTDMQGDLHPQTKKSPRRKRFIVAAVVLLLAVGYLSYVNFSASAAYYVTPSELKAKGTEAIDQKMRMDGAVVPGTVEWNGKTLQLTFTITDKTGVQEKAAFPVSYRGVLPDTFKEGGEVIVEGTFNASGTFQATKLWARCPSRFEEKT